MSPAARMSEMTWPEFAERVKADPVVFVPIGAFEQHGPHLAMSCDAVLPTAVAEGVAARVGGMVAPTFNYGYTSQPKTGGGPHYPGTLNLEGATVVALVRDVLRELYRHGIRRICCVVGHYENRWFVSEGIQLALREIADPGLRVMRFEYWDFCTREIYDQVFPDGFPGAELEHAAVMETSCMLHLRPDLVRPELIPDDPPADFPPYDMYPPHKHWTPASGALTTARAASAEKGRIMMEHYYRSIAEAVRKELAAA